MALKRAHEDAAGPDEAARGARRAKRNPEVQPVGQWVTRDAVLSPYVREALMYCEPRGAPFFAYWNRIAVSGTNVAKAVGLNPYPDGSPIALWMRLRGHADAEPALPPERMARIEHGINAEPVARAHYERALRVAVTRHDHCFAPGLSWCLHGCDGHARGRQNVRALVGAEHPYCVEIKCPEKPYGSIPREYMVQMQVGMALHGHAWQDFVEYTTRRAPGDAEGAQPLVEHLRIRRVHRSAAAVELLVTHLAYFVDCLRHNVPPRAAMGIPPAKHALFDEPSISVTPVFDADVPPLPAESGGSAPLTV